MRQEASVNRDFREDDAHVVAQVKRCNSVRRVQSLHRSGGGDAAGGKRCGSQLSWSTSSCAPSNQCRRLKKRSVSFRDGLRQGEKYQVLILGASGVGKTSLVRQFQRSSAPHTTIKLTNIYGESCKRANDAQLTIIDNPTSEVSTEMAIACCDVDAYVVVYSVTDKKSFDAAKEIVKNLLSQESYVKKAAILVGNKVDLARRRIVNTEDGKALATSSGCKFIETSDWIDYNIAELFDGVLAQIRLRLEQNGETNGAGEINGAENQGKNIKTSKKSSCKKSKTLGAKSWNVLKDLINLINRNVRPCEDLQTL